MRYRSLDRSYLACATLYHVVIIVVVVKKVENIVSFRAWYFLAKTGSKQLFPMPMVDRTIVNLFLSSQHMAHHGRQIGCAIESD